MMNASSESGTPSRFKKAAFLVAAMLILMAGIAGGICALAGACGLVWGPAVFEPGRPDWSQPHSWVMIILLAPAIVGGMAVSCGLVVLLAAWIRYPLVEMGSWGRIVGLYRFVRRARYTANAADREKEEVQRGRIMTMPAREYCLRHAFAGAIAGVLWSLAFFPIMSAIGEPVREITLLDRFALPVPGFAFGGVLAGWILRRLVSKGPRE